MQNRKSKKSTQQLNLLEELTSTGEAAGLEVEELDKQSLGIRTPFDPEKIDVITKDHMVELILTRIKEGEMELSPDFQRRANLWNIERKSRLIESILLRIPLPSLYVSEDLEGDYTVIDGLQRICAIAHFVDVNALNKSVKSKLPPLKLTNLQSLGEYEGATYKDLPRSLQRRIVETELTMHVIRAGTPQEVKFNIFSRLNQGGLPLTPQEIRHAIYKGVWREHVNELAKSKEFLEATGNKIKTERMDDLELILRFIALYEHGKKLRAPDQALDDFLNETVEKTLPKWNPSQWRAAKEAFKRGVNAGELVFEKHAFRKYYDEDTRNPINRGLFEAEVVALCALSTEQVKKLASRRKKVLNLLRHTIEHDNKFDRSLKYSTGFGFSSNKRLSVVREIFKEVLDA